MWKNSNPLVIACVTSLLIGCGGGSSSSSPASGATSETGVLLDEAVTNIGYRTETLEGVTNSQGQYNYIEGETVTFFIGDLEFPPITASGIVTPLDMAGTEDTSNPTVVNILRLLQSIDEDGNPDNGITITETAKNNATQIDFDVSVSDFSSSSAVTTFIANSGSTNTTLISESEAIAHFEETLIEEGEGFEPSTSIAGVWVNEETTNELLAFVFFQNGTYVHMEIDEIAPLNPDNPNEVSGMEWGTYSIDPETRELTASITFDGNDDTGLTDSIGQVDIFAQVDGDTLTLEIDDNDNSTIEESEAIEFTRSSNAGILGAWTNTETTNELLAFVFFDNGTYAHLEVDEVAPLNTENPNEVSGMEWGTYSIDPETGELTASITFDGNDDTGLTDSIGQVDIFAQVDGDTLTLQIDDNDNGSISEGEEFAFNRAPMPSYEPASSSIDLTQYSINSTMTNSDCPSASPLGWNYVFTETAVTLSGSDSVITSGSVCSAGAQETFVDPIVDYSLSYQGSFWTCENYPVCTVSELNRTYDGFDYDGDERVLITISHTPDSNTITWVQEEDLGSTWTEIITLTPLQ